MIEWRVPKQEGTKIQRKSYNTYVDISIHMHTYIHTYTCMHTYIYTYICIHKQIAGLCYVVMQHNKFLNFCVFSTSTEKKITQPGGEHKEWTFTCASWPYLRIQETKSRETQIPFAESICEYKTTQEKKTREYKRTWREKNKNRSPASNGYIYIRYIKIKWMTR